MIIPVLLAAISSLLTEEKEGSNFTQDNYWTLVTIAPCDVPRKGYSGESLGNLAVLVLDPDYNFWNSVVIYDRKFEKWSRCASTRTILAGG